MNGSRTDVEKLVGELLDYDFGCEVLLLPPFVYLDQVGGLLGDSQISLGAQDVDWHDQGAFTGGVSAAMLKDLGCEYCLVGHSERRMIYGESLEVTADKYLAALEGGICPILCVGETLAEREQSQTLERVTSQLTSVQSRVGAEGLRRGIIAYEPVWAIGTGKSASPAQAEQVHAGIRAWLETVDPDLASVMRILYGGSVNAGNAAELMQQENIDGALVGGASLKATEFAAICEAAAPN
ncbi:MAG: triose-phosphate isomerase [Pseudomonadota bacterium]